MAKLSAHGKPFFVLDKDVTEEDGCTYYQHLVILEDGAVLRKTGWSKGGKVRWSGYTVFVHAKQNTPEYLKEYFTAKGWA